MVDNNATSQHVSEGAGITQSVDRQQHQYNPSYTADSQKKQTTYTNNKGYLNSKIRINFSSTGNNKGFSPSRSSPAQSSSSSRSSPLSSTSLPSSSLSSSSSGGFRLCRCGLKQLLLFVLSQLCILVVMQWKFSSVIQLITGEKKPTAMSRLDYPSQLLAPPENVPVDPLGIALIDVHDEHPELGHTYENYGHHPLRTTIDPADVAIGLAVTSTKLEGREPLERWPFFKDLMVSFCTTASKGYNYNFFLAFDYIDKFFIHTKNIQQFILAFKKYAKMHCPQDAKTTYAIHFVRCSHAGRPANAQNDAMMAAYMMNMAYFYRINDDTLMTAGKWTETFINVLRKNYDPPRVGVVGPNHKNGNTAILTYDFVHSTHVDIFGFYYPHQFTDWWADTWISDVYKPGRVTKVKAISLVHTQSIGKRYQVHYKIHDNLKPLLERGQALITRYVKALTRNKAKGLHPQPNKIIAMTLYGNDPANTYGAVRNAQLMPVFFPDWSLHIYVDQQSNNQMLWNSYATNPAAVVNSDAEAKHEGGSFKNDKSGNSSVEGNVTHAVNIQAGKNITLSKENVTQHQNISEHEHTHDLTTIGTTSTTFPVTKTKKYTVPPLILNKLYTLGAKIVFINGSVSDPSLWRYEALDNLAASHVLIRDVAGRITERDRQLVESWMKQKNASLLSMREVKRAGTKIAPASVLPTGGNVGVDAKLLKNRQSIKDFSNEYYKRKSELPTEENYLTEILQPASKDSLLYYDAISCDQKTKRLPFPNKSERKDEFFGQQYNIYDEGLLKKEVKEECYTKNAEVL